MADSFDLTLIGTTVDVAMPAGSVGVYVYVGTDGSLTCTPLPDQNPLYIKISDTQGILLDGGSIDPTPEATETGTWKYSRYLIEDNPAIRTSLLKQHILEVANQVASPYSLKIGEANWSKEQIQSYLATLKSELRSLQFQTGAKMLRPYTVGRSRL